MPATKNKNANNRNMASPDIGSDGNRSAQSLTSNDFITDSVQRIPNPCQMRDLQIQEGSIDTQNIREIAMKAPHMVEWNRTEEVDLTRTADESFGLRVKLRIITQSREGPKDLFLLVDNVESNSPASTILNRGDLILSANRKPIHCTKFEFDKNEFVASISRLMKESERLHLVIQTPRRRRQKLPSIKSNTNSQQCSLHFSHAMSVCEQSLGTRQSARLYDTLNYLQTAERTCQDSVLPKVPYSKIILLGENNTMLAKVFLGFGSNKMKRIDSFSKGSFLLQNSEESGWERTFKRKPSVVTFKTWLRDPQNLKQCLDSKTQRIVEAQLVPTRGRCDHDEFRCEKNSIFVDLFAPVHSNICVGNLAASLLMTGNEVYILDVSATRLLTELHVCLKEVQSLLNRIRSLAGQKVPVLLVITYRGKLDEHVRMAVGEALKNFEALMMQLVHFDTSSNCCFLNLDDTDLADDSPSTTVGSEQSLSAEITNFNTPLKSLRFKVMQLLWEQTYLEKYRVHYLKYLELFWRMTEKTKDHKYYFKREIKEACCIRNDTEFSDFVTYLKFLGELSGETSHVRHVGHFQEIFLRPSSLHSPLTKMLSGTSEERQLTHLREEWNRLKSTGIASSVLLRKIFDDCEESSTISYLESLGIMFPLSPRATQSLDVPLPNNPKDSYNLLTAVSTAETKCQCFLCDARSLHIKFSGWIPAGFSVKLVLKIIENINYTSIRWRICQSGCHEISTETGYTLLFQEDILASSIKMSTLFKGKSQPNQILQLLIKSTREIVLSEDERPLVGCHCPLTHKDNDHRHVLDLDIEHQPYILCGNQRLNEHPWLSFWLTKKNWQDSQPMKMASSHYSRHEDRVSLVAESSDDLSYLNPMVYSWLCEKLNVLDCTTQRDWRLVAAKLGFKKEDIDFFDNPRPEWNPCHRLFERWIQMGMATISRLRQVLEEIGRKDIICELDRKKWSFY